MSTALLVFAKVPQPGAVKTRLTPVLTPQEAAQLYDAFLKDALRLYSRLSAAVRLYLAPPLPEEGLQGIPSRVTVHEQEGDGLGARMKTAFRETFEAGYERIAVIGTDHPTLPLSFVRQGWTALEPPRSICIGPSADGGFYLLGMNAFYPHLFEDMRYSHEEVFSDTLSRIETTDAQLTVLPRWYDVDTPAALQRMVGELDNEETAPAPNTRAAIERLNLDALSAVE